MKRISIFIMLLLISFLSFAQADLFNYQGVARTATGAPIITKPLGIKITILQGNATGTIVYEETHNTTTNAYGLFQLAIGNGTVVSGDIKTINWGKGDHFMKVEMDPNGGTSYTDLGTNQLLAVPYAKYASGINIYQSGTANPDKVIIGHSPAYQDWGVVYNDQNDIIKFIRGNVDVFNIDLGNNTITYPHFSKGEGKVLTSDADGNATWKNNKTIVTSITLPACTSLASVSTTPTKIVDLGTFTKINDNTFIELDYATQFRISTLAAGATGAIFELRINNNKTTLGKASYLMKVANTSIYATISGVFPSLPAGSYTISLWVYTSYFTGTGAGIDEGCWNSFGVNSLIVKEFH